MSKVLKRFPMKRWNHKTPEKRHNFFLVYIEVINISDTLYKTQNWNLWLVFLLLPLLLRILKALSPYVHDLLSMYVIWLNQVSIAILKARAEFSVSYAVQDVGKLVFFPVAANCKGFFSVFIPIPFTVYIWFSYLLIIVDPFVSFVCAVTGLSGLLLVDNIKHVC